MINAITCSDCRYFRSDVHNPTAAMGRCMHDARHGYFFANEHHRCVDHAAKMEPKPEAEPVE